MRNNKVIVMKLSGLMYLMVIVAIVMSPVAMVEAAKAPASSDAVKIKPDIAISELKINRISVVPSGHNVLVNVTVINPVRNTATGPFKVKVEWTSDPTMGYNLLGTGGVTGLNYDMASAVIKNRKTLSFSHQVPTGESYKYRVTADYLNQVDEADETNNLSSAGYTTLSFP
ncbi:MAG TPA: CARDB domain-containing protein [Methanothrix sp.]|nr:CARDB domain-containing protein [Methanothrix sp.]